MKLSIKLQQETSNYGTIIGITNLSSVCCLKANHNTAGMSFFLVMHLQMPSKMFREPVYVTPP